MNLSLCCLTSSHQTSIAISTEAFAGESGKPESEDQVDYLMNNLLRKSRHFVARYVETQVFYALLNPLASNHAAQMTAMDSASKNAGEVIDSLTLNMNRVRQGIHHARNHRSRIRRAGAERLKSQFTIRKREGKAVGDYYRLCLLPALRLGLIGIPILLVAQNSSRFILHSKLTALLLSSEDVRKPRHPVTLFTGTSHQILGSRRLDGELDVLFLHRFFFQRALRRGS